MTEFDTQAITEAFRAQQDALASKSGMWTFTIVVAVIVTAGVINAIAQRLIAMSQMEATLKKFIASMLRILIISLTVVICATSLGIPVNSLIAVLSIAGLALSLSIQKLLSNLFSGMTLLASKPFIIGDFVEMCGITGTIREVGIISTTVATPDNRVIFIPNGDITGGNIINYSREPKRRVDLTISAAYGSEPESVISAIREAVSSDGRIHTEPEPFIALSGYGESSVEYILRVWTDNADYWDVNYAVKRGVYESFKRHGIEWGLNHLSVQIKDSR